VTDEMLSNFPLRDLDEPVTKDFVRAEIAGVRSEIADVKTLIQSTARAQTRWLAGAVIAGAGILVAADVFRSRSVSLYGRRLETLGRGARRGRVHRLPGGWNARCEVPSMLRAAAESSARGRRIVQGGPPACHIEVDMADWALMYGKFVRAVRESRGISQEVLAGISGIDQPNISAIERDRRLPSLETLNRLVVACGYELAAVAGERVIPVPVPQVGWFPDEDLPEPHPDDPVDEPPTVTAATPIEERVRVIHAVLDASVPR
jgi:transcriptional regulator with XRE-family HTH domain